MKVSQNFTSRGGTMGSILVTLYSKEGVIKKQRKFPMRSFVRNFWRMYFDWGRGTNWTGQTMSGASFSESVNTGFGSSSEPNYEMSTEGWLRGLSVGTSAEPYNITQSSLGDLIDHGTSEGRLRYLIGAHNYDPDEGSTTLTRSFLNQSGDPITVRELGLGFSNVSNTNDPANTILMARDVFPTEFTIENEETLSVVFNMFFTEGTANFQGGLSLSSNNRSAINTLGNTVSVRHKNIIQILAGSGPGNDHIRLGSGDTPPEYEDVDLDSIIPVGSADGELSSVSATVSGWSVDEENGEISYMAERIFWNQGTTPVEVREIGMRGWGGTSSYGFLQGRRVFDTPVIINPGETRGAVWRFSYKA